MNIRRIARAGAWTAGGFVLLAIGLYLIVLAINWRDEPASADVRRFEQMHAQRPRVAHEQNAVVHVLGMAAAPGQDPIALGIARMTRLENFDPEAADAFDMRGQDVEVLEARSEAAHALNAACHEPSKVCAERLQADPAAVEQWLASEAWLLSRYGTLIALPRWAETVPTDFRAPLPAYQHTMNAQKLHLLQAWQAARAGDAARVQALLDADMRFWRNVLASSDLLLTKMVASAGVRRNLGFGSLALRELPVEHAASAVPPSWREPIRDSERSLLRAMAGEWRFSKSALRAATEPDAWQSLTGHALGPLDVLVKPLLHPQATGNLMAGHMARLAEASTRPYDELARGRHRLSAGAPAAGNPLYNPLGRTLASIGGAGAYEPYLMRVSDLEGARRMALLAAQMRRDAVPMADVTRAAGRATLRDPYNGDAFRWDAAQGAFVYEGLGSARANRHLIVL